MATTKMERCPTCRGPWLDALTKANDLIKAIALLERNKRSGKISYGECDRDVRDLLKAAGKL